MLCLQDHLRVWMSWSVFGKLLYQEMCSRSYNTTMRDYVAWMKVLFTLMFYKCTVKAFFQNRNQMFKPLSMEWGLSRDKSLDMWRALQPLVCISFMNLYALNIISNSSANITFFSCKNSRTFLNRMMRDHRMFYGSLLL